MVNLEWYRSFVGVYRVGTMSGAAEVLHLTQPAVSQHIAALESTLGTALFQRMPRRMLPTEAGKLLYNRVVSAIETLESVPIKSGLSHAPLLIRLGTPSDFFNEMILRQLSTTSDSVLTVRFGLAQELIDQLLASQIDGAIATQKITHPALEYKLIFEETFWLVAPAETTIPDTLDGDQNSLSQSRLKELEQWLQAQPWIAYSEELPIIRRFWRMVFGRRLDISPRLIIPELRSIREAIAQGLGFSILPDYLCKAWVADQRLKLILQPSPPVSNSIWLAYRKSERQSQQVIQLSKQLGLPQN